MKTETLLQVVAEKEKKIELLENEVSRLETQTETMSTSTVSRVEEVHRMRDVEDSLEDRYNKLKMLAVKMKKRIAELNGELQDKERQLNAFKTDEKANHVRNTPLNLQVKYLNTDVHLFVNRHQRNPIQIHRPPRKRLTV